MRSKHFFFNEKITLYLYDSGNDPGKGIEINMLVMLTKYGC